MLESDNKKLDINFKLFAVLGGILLVALTVNMIASFKTGAFVSRKVIEAEEVARPAELRLTVINANCEDCFEMSGFLAGLKQFNVKIVEEKQVEWQSEEGKNLITKYKIDKIPTLLVSGEINKDVNLKNIWPQIGEVVDNNFVLRRVGTPYIEVTSGEKRGGVEIILLKDDTCFDCYDVRAHQQILTGFGLPTQNARLLSMSEGEGLTLKNKYSVILAPTFIISGEVEAYPELAQVWSQVGTVEADGAYVFREGVKQMGIYKNLLNGQVIRPEVTDKN